MTLHVQSIQFISDDRIEITYVEDDDVSPSVVLVKTVVLDPSAAENEVVVLHGAAVDLIEAALTVKRNPPNSFTRSRDPREQVRRDAPEGDG